MSTSAIINFTFDGEVYPYYVNSDGYPATIVQALKQLKFFCVSGLLTWADVKKHVKKYDGGLGFYPIYTDKFDLVPNLKVENMFDPFKDGCSERKGEFDAYGSYIYNVGEKIKTIEEIKKDSCNIKTRAIDKKTAQRSLVYTVFRIDKTGLWQG